MPPAMRLRRSQRGFTLIEMVVVIVVIGVLASFASLGIGNRVNDDKLTNEAERLKAILQLASEEAEAKGVDIGVRFTQGGYRLLVLDSNRRWGDYENSGALRRRQYAIPLGLRLTVDGRPIPLPKDLTVEEEAEDGLDRSARFHTREDDAARRITPQVLLLSSGEMTPFALDMDAPGLRSGYRLEADALGRLKLARPIRRTG
jgi:general secretion pathway protein H